MKIQTISVNRWLYPDDMMQKETDATELVSAKGGSACVQLLTDMDLRQSECIDFTWSAPDTIALDLYRLIAVQVEANSARDRLTTMDYESVADFVTRRAPFMVYDAMEEVVAGACVPEGRLAFFVRVNVAAGSAVGFHECVLRLNVGGQKAEINIKLAVTQAIIPPLEQASFGVVNWLDLKRLAEAHKVKQDSSEFWKITERYVKHQLDMRSNHLMLPSGVPLRDENNRVVDFDFAMTEKLGKMALRAGFSYVYGGFVARFKQWNDSEHYLLWDRDIGVSSHEGYRQLKLYFEKLWALVLENGWEHNYMQCMVDEPQFQNSLSYRVLGGICRKCMPGVVIHDPVETTTIEGALDIWCVKQQVFENHLEEYKALQALGEEMWIYTCGYPAGKMMNRVLDLPLAATRLVSWMCSRHGAKGFLHWGYNSYHTDAPFEKTCLGTVTGDFMPPGNSFIVYPGNEGPLYSVRAQLQKLCAEDFELLTQLTRKNPQLADEISGSVCRSFEDYETDPGKLDMVCNKLRMEA
ncbi:MAG: DUF4091 domain-containing protein [Ruminococcaceae bacterium]|nr:DUF4091 domain-containing protein [Oscillospiraceae bacterium]